MREKVDRGLLAAKKRYQDDYDERVPTNAYAKLRYSKQTI